MTLFSVHDAGRPSLTNLNAANAQGDILYIATGLNKTQLATMEVSRYRHMQLDFRFREYEQCNPGYQGQMQCWRSSFYSPLGVGQANMATGYNCGYNTSVPEWFSLNEHGEDLTWSQKLANVTTRNLACVAKQMSQVYPIPFPGYKDPSEKQMADLIKIFENAFDEPTCAV
jgi:hypothetical protein